MDSECHKCFFCVKEYTCKKNRDRHVREKHADQVLDQAELGSTLMDMLKCMERLEKNGEEFAKKCGGMAGRLGDVQARMANIEAKVDRLVASSLRTEAGPPRYVLA